MRIMNSLSTLLAATAMVVGTSQVYAQSVSGQGTWETTLLGRDINLNAVSATSADSVYLYDTTLNVTWLRNANSNGRMDWTTANNWAANLVTGSGAAAISDWRLPTMAANPSAGYSYDGSTALGYNVAVGSSELASLFFSTLGNKSYLNTSGAVQPGYGLTNGGSFQNMQNAYYWLATEYTPDPSHAWFLYTYNGRQYDAAKYEPLYAMAVRSGDVIAAVPEPETYAMLLAGLGLVAAIVRRRRGLSPSLPLPRLKDQHRDAAGLASF